MWTYSCSVYELIPWLLNYSVHEGYCSDKLCGLVDIGQKPTERKPVDGKRRISWAPPFMGLDLALHCTVHERERNILYHGVVNLWKTKGIQSRPSLRLWSVSRIHNMERINYLLLPWCYFQTKYGKMPKAKRRVWNMEIIHTDCS
jgi:hypothetical protein